MDLPALFVGFFLHRHAYLLQGDLEKSGLPIEEPTKFRLVLNLKAGKALGIRVPQSILMRADEVIQ